MGKLLVFLLCTLMASYASAQHVEMALVNEGIYTPLYGSAEEGQVSVNAFYMDVTPVTHVDFLEFVKEFPQWQKTNVKRLFANERYLDNWSDNTSFPDHLANTPVNNVSWFAAKAYCECQGKRLPTVDEWEFAAMASENRTDARTDSLFQVRILKNYEKPRTYLTSVGQGPKNYWGVKDLHGLVWEWTLDFNSIIITGESRNNGNTDRGLFCASGAVGASDLMNYAAFMRYALRSSLKANYALTNLGFRCVMDMEGHDLLTRK